MARCRFFWFVLLVAFPNVAFAQTEPPYGEAETPEKGAGTISGQVVDKQTGQPVEGVTIEVVGTEIRAVTDERGRYQLEVPAGKYALRIYGPGYLPLRAQNVVIWPGANRKIDVPLEAEAAVAEEYVIEAAPDSTSVDALAIERKKSAAMGDSVGRAEMSKTADRNAAQAAKRVVGVTIVNNRFVYVRGLGERYTNALLNGVPLPSPEPDRAAVPLDLFPTLVLENMTIVKTFTPDVPADFAGGSVRIETRSIPEKPVFQVSLSGGYNSQATFRDRLTHRGSSTDWLGFDGGAREFPSAIPEDQLATENATPEQKTERGNALNTFMSAERAFTPPNFGASVVWGDSWKLGAERKLGFIGTLNYSRSFNVRRGVLRRTLDPLPEAPDGVEAITDSERNPLTGEAFDGEERGEDTVSWGAFGALTYQFDKSHKLALTGLHTQLADKTTTISEASYKSNNYAPLYATRLQFVSRALDYVQLGGEHDFQDLERAKLDWFASYARATRTEPNTRNTVYSFNNNDPTNPFWGYYDSSESGQHFWADQYENSIGAGANWTQPLSSEDQPETRLKLGGLVNLRSRNFEARRLALRKNGQAADRQVFVCPGAEFQQSCIDDLFIPANITTNLKLEEGTEAADAYDADLNVFAAYVMADASLARDLRLIVGERVEVTHQTIQPYDQFNRPNFDVPEGAELDSTDLLPAIALVYSPSDRAKTRFAVTRTLARPQLRELAPFAYSDYFGGRRISGNPNLDLTRIINADARFEYFPTLSEVLAFSVFYKHFRDPIEPIIKPSGDKGLVTFQNAEGANLIGIELEARKSLEFLAHEIRDLSFIGNLTIAHSRIQIRDSEDTDVTHASRAMVNQAPYVVNAALDYANKPLGVNVRLSWNFIGSRIVEVGTDGLDDAYEQKRHTFDLTGIKSFGEHFEVKLAAQNITNSPIVQTQGPEETDAKVIRRWTDGALYTLSASYTY